MFTVKLIKTQKQNIAGHQDAIQLIICEQDLAPNSALEKQNEKHKLEKRLPVRGSSVFSNLFQGWPHKTVHQRAFEMHEKNTRALDTVLVHLSARWLTDVYTALHFRRR